ncbi:NADP-dependent malic enzyme-like [Plodia interpunctella]|uniref:NADP-dependent malic enzyme-like n=1 Tax=Plodia interpunctella TaxID=58824 RepID=UPI002368C0CB|nr:NADP-dependent malic enzyme-like [Plodia interpunctella]
MFTKFSKTLSYLKACPKQFQFGATAIIQPNSIRYFRENVTVPNSIRGIDHIRDPKFNKGLAFSLRERQALGLQGLLAAKVTTLDQQVHIMTISLDRYLDDLNKYMFLVEVRDTNEKLFFNLLASDIEKYLPIVYTPTVGLACQKFGITYKRPRGLFVTIHDKGHVYSIMRNWPENDVKAIVFTDGERILGLGDLGAYGMGISVGKLALYTALAGIQPHQCLPIMIDVGTNNESLLADPLYIGCRHKRIKGDEYLALLDEFMEACVKRYGRNTLLQFEDFALENAGPLLTRYKNKYCTFNDDIQGTASVVVSGLLAARRITKKKMCENITIFLGAGSAATGIAHLMVSAMVDEGISEKEAQAKIYMHDVEGLLTTKRPGGVPAHAVAFGKNDEPEKSFEAVVAKLKATCIIGCSTVGGLFTPAILKQMAKNTERPIIFALSNPTSKAECTAQQAYDNTEGRCVYASGSPFPPVKYGGKEYLTGQGNNSYIFPGVALGVIATACHTVTDKMFLIAAETLAKLVKEEDLAIGRIYPPLKQVKDVSLDIAVEVSEYAYKENIATVHPKPDNLKEFIRAHIYSLDYENILPDFFDYPEIEPPIPIKSYEEIANAFKPKKPVPRTKPPPAQ